jgi:hypothetical protein
MCFSYILFLRLSSSSESKLLNGVQTRQNSIEDNLLSFREPTAGKTEVINNIQIKIPIIFLFMFLFSSFK